MIYGRKITSKRNNCRVKSLKLVVKGENSPVEKIYLDCFWILPRTRRFNGVLLTALTL